jgi:glycosyltransferase involved in cell wall biosynthesis
MKILILNWRDIKNPRAGGAEVLTHELAKGWVAAGCEVTFFSSFFKGAKKRENVDGLSIIRAGNAISVYWQAYCYYKKEFKGKFDLIIDEINTMPFFSNLYAKEKVVCHINQLAKEVWFYESVFPLSLLGYLIEPFFLKSYRNNDVITISKSTKDDLVNLGFKAEKIDIIPMGIEFEPLAGMPEKEEKPTLIYVGRLKKSKRVHHIIEAYKLAKIKLPDLKLWVIGNGDVSYKTHLYKLAKDEAGIKFFHSLNNKDKLRLMSLAHLIVVTSAREGWGLIVTEANAMGTPALTYDVPGLRDSNKDKLTGFVCRENNPLVLSNEIISFFADQQLRQKLSSAALEDSRQYSWQRTVKKSLEIINKLELTDSRSKA